MGLRFPSGQLVSDKDRKSKLIHVKKNVPPFIGLYMISGESCKLIYFINHYKLYPKIYGHCYLQATSGRQIKPIKTYGGHYYPPPQKKRRKKKKRRLMCLILLDKYLIKLNPIQQGGTPSGILLA